MLPDMRRKVGKRLAIRFWRFFKWAVGWPLAIFGASGIPDQLGQWEDYIGRAAARVHAAMTDPHVVYLAEKAVEIANFVNHPAVRVALVIVGVAILIWGRRPFRSLRHRLRFKWRVFLGEETWISRDDAFEAVRVSDWAKAKQPSRSLLGATGLLMGLNEEHQTARFKLYVNLALDQFEQFEPGEVRERDGKKEYAESKLLLFLRRSMKEELEKEFGPLPKATL